MSDGKQHIAKNAKLYVKNRVRHMLWTLLILTVAAWGLSFCADTMWVADLLSNFTVQFTAVFFILVVGLVISGSRIGTFIAIIMLCISIYKVAVPHYVSKNPYSAPPAETIKVLQYNLFYYNKNITQITDWILQKENDIDIIVLQEIPDNKRHLFNKLKQEYPYNIGNSEMYPYGLGIFSKVPVISHEYIEISSPKDGYVKAMFQTAEKSIPFVLYNIHPFSPVSPIKWKLRNQSYVHFAQQIQNEPLEHRIIVGDFNSTIWSPHIQNFISKSGLSNAQAGFGLDKSWSFFKSKPLLFSIYIDQMLASNNITVQSRESVQDLGSDHLPILTELGFY